MDREERLRSAKEKLKKFQKKKQNDNPATPSSNDHSLRSTPKGELETVRATPESQMLFTFESKNDTTDPFVPTTTEDQQSMASEVSDQIDQILTASTVRRISDVTSDDLELCRMRNSELEKEKVEIGLINQQLKTQLQQLETDLNASNAKVEKMQENLEAMIKDQKEKEDEVAVASKSQLDSIQILVSEKTDLASTVSRQQKLIQDMTVALEEQKLQKSKPSSRERTCACTDRVFLAEVERKRLSDTVSNLRDEKDRLKIEVIDLKQEGHELKSKVEHHETNSIIRDKQLSEIASKLELAEMNLSQLRSSALEQEIPSAPEDQRVGEEMKAEILEKDSEISRLTSENEEHVKRVEELTAYIQRASQDREQIIQQYTSYSQHLTAQIETLTQQVNAKASEVNLSASREADLLAHVERLENQLQNSMKNEAAAVSDGNGRKSQERWSPSSEKEIEILRSQMIELDKKVLDLQLERDSLQETVQVQNVQLKSSQAKSQEQEALIGDLETKLEMSATNLVDHSQHETLLAASTSDKVAASRAMQQNLELKKQVEELENAVIQVTDTKAQMLTELDSAKTKINQFQQSDTSTKSLLNGLQESVKERDRTIHQLKEQIKYYVAFAEHSVKNTRQDLAESNDLEGTAVFNNEKGEEGNKHVDDLIEELQTCREEIRCLNSHNSELKSQLEVISSQIDHNGDRLSCSSSSSSTSTSEDSKDGADHTTIINNNNSITNNDAVNETFKAPTNSENGNGADFSPILSKDVAMVKIEQKLTQAMQKIVDLTSEKEHLEHTIIRLQDETDTVGEYITIYHYQRAQQKAQLLEKEKQLHSIARDREELKQKLDQLQGLLTNYIGHHPENDHTDDRAVTESAVTTSNSEAPCEVAQEAEAFNMANEKKTEAAGKIMSLLSEIGSNEMLTSIEHFQPWFWEPSHGKLMTV